MYVPEFPYSSSQHVMYTKWNNIATGMPMFNDQNS